MIDEMVRALNDREWPDHVHGQLGPRIGDAVAPFLRPVVGAAVAEPGPVPPGSSKLGGLPDVDSQFAWPTEEDTDEPLALVAQLNLAELPPGELPGRGMLYLFSIYDGDRAYGYEIDDATARIVHVPAASTTRWSGRCLVLGRGPF